MKIAVSDLVISQSLRMERLNCLTLGWLRTTSVNQPRKAPLGRIRDEARSVQPKVLLLHIFYKAKETVFAGSQFRDLGSCVGLLASHL
jgi:hypothetical protein